MAHDSHATLSSTMLLSSTCAPTDELLRCNAPSAKSSARRTRSFSRHWSVGGACVGQQLPPANDSETLAQGVLCPAPSRYARQPNREGPWPPWVTPTRFPTNPPTLRIEQGTCHGARYG